MTTEITKTIVNMIISPDDYNPAIHVQAQELRELGFVIDEKIPGVAIIDRFMLADPRPTSRPRWRWLHNTTELTG